MGGSATALRAHCCGEGSSSLDGTGGLRSSSSSAPARTTAGTSVAWATWSSSERTSSPKSGTETAGGVTVGTFAKLAKAGRIDKNETTVLCITGQGLKTIDALMEPGVLPAAPTIKPTLGAFRDLKLG